MMSGIDRAHRLHVPAGGNHLAPCWHPSASTQETGEASGGDAVEAGFEIALAAQADNLIGNLALMKEEQGRDGADAILGCQGLLLVNVHFANSDAAIVLLGQLIQNRYQSAARAAPFSPEINEDGCAGFKDFFGEVLLG
jgi:hypothetical protein